jgi:hypothetical protein
MVKPNGGCTMLKTTLAALILTLAPGLAFAAGCSMAKSTAMSCANGTMPDAETGTCVPVTTS